MTKRLAICCIALLAGFALFTSAQEKQALRLVQTIHLPGVTGRLDHVQREFGLSHKNLQAG